jgi:hypothetical protein
MSDIDLWFILSSLAALIDVVILFAQLMFHKIQFSFIKSGYPFYLLSVYYHNVVKINKKSTWRVLLSVLIFINFIVVLIAYQA